MNSHTSETAGSTAEQEIRSLYHQLLECWNSRNADAFAALFSENGNVVGFDGSQMNRPEERANTLRPIFADHPTATYIGIIREIRFPVPGAAVLRAVVGMVPRGGTDINPAVNAIQSMLAVREQNGWRIQLFHNTPAAFHGRPEASQQLTEELRQALHDSRSAAQPG